MQLEDFIQDKLQHYGSEIRKHDGDTEDHALGAVLFYAALRRTVSGKATRQDLGMLGAVNDTLQELGIIDSKETFFKR